MEEAKKGDANTMTVTIPSRQDHEGIYSMEVTISDKCPVCGGERGKPFPALSYDGSRRLNVDSWENKCGHVDKYSAIREEVQRNLVKQLA